MIGIADGVADMDRLVGVADRSAKRHSQAGGIGPACRNDLARACLLSLLRQRRQVRIGGQPSSGKPSGRRLRTTGQAALWMEHSHFCCALRLSPGADSYGLLKTVGGLPAVSTMVRLKQRGAGGDCGEAADNASRYGPYGSGARRCRRKASTDFRFPRRNKSPWTWPVPSTSRRDCGSSRLPPARSRRFGRSVRPYPGLPPAAGSAPSSGPRRIP